MTVGPRHYLAEGIGTALLLTVIVGSGAMATRLGGSGIGMLFAHALVVGAGIAAIIVAVGPVSGAHLNPVVTVVAWRLGRMDPRGAAWYVGAQLIGAVAGVAVGNLMFELPILAVSGTQRAGAGAVIAEAVATFGLVLVIFGAIEARQPAVLAFAVGSWVAVAIVATSSTGFANPAVTVARQFTRSYTGIAPSSVSAFLAGEAAGAALGLVALRRLHPRRRPPSDEPPADQPRILRDPDRGDHR